MNFEYSEIDLKRGDEIVGGTVKHVFDDSVEIDTGRGKLRSLSLERAQEMRAEWLARDTNVTRVCREAEEYAAKWSRKYNERAGNDPDEDYQENSA